MVATMCVFVSGVDWVEREFLPVTRTQTHHLSDDVYDLHTYRPQSFDRTQQCFLLIIFSKIHGFERGPSINPKVCPTLTLPTTGRSYRLNRSTSANVVQATWIHQFTCYNHRCKHSLIPSHRINMGNSNCRTKRAWAWLLPSTHALVWARCRE